MNSVHKTLHKVLAQNFDKNIKFVELVNLLSALNLDCRIKGSHHIFTKATITEIINLQPIGIYAKPYQVKQVRELIIRYNLNLEHNNDERNN